MANYVLTSPTIYLNEQDLTTNLTYGAINYSSELVEDTCMGDLTKSRVGGMKVAIVDLNGYIDRAEPDKEIFDNIAYNSAHLTISPTTGADGEPAYIMAPVLTTYSMKAVMNEKYAFNLHAEMGEHAHISRLVKGTMLHGKATRTATNNSTAIELGAVGATQRLYGVLHCFSASAGDTLSVYITSDADAGFGSQTVQITFTQVAAGVATSQILSAAGPIADTWWRISYVIAGADPSFSFAVAMGIA